MVKTMGIGGIFGVGLYYIGLPLIWVARLLFSILWFILAPFIYLGQSMLYVILIPCHILAKFEVSLAIAENPWSADGHLETRCLSFK
jgi:phosphate/sulfate permease